MDYTKAIRPDLINTYTGSIVTNYAKARSTSDYYKEEEYANKAIFKSNKIAKQETLKAQQKEMSAGVYNKDSGSIVAHINRGQMGISSVLSNKNNGEWEDDETASYIISDRASGQSFMSENSFATNHEVYTNIFLELKRISNISPTIKLVIAWRIFISKYDCHLTEEHREFFRDEFRTLEAINDGKGEKKIRKNQLWMSTKLSRYQIRQALETIASMRDDLKIKSEPILAENLFKYI